MSRLQGELQSFREVAAWREAEDLVRGNDSFELVRRPHKTVGNRKYSLPSRRCRIWLSNMSGCKHLEGFVDSFTVGLFCKD